MEDLEKSLEGPIFHKTYIIVTACVVLCKKIYPPPERPDDPSTTLKLLIYNEFEPLPTYYYKTTGPL